MFLFCSCVNRDATKAFQLSRRVGMSRCVQGYIEIRAKVQPCGNQAVLGMQTMATTATILHADLDAFYASVEQLLDPSLRGKPIAVGGGVVLAASYEAKAFGIRGGMPGRQARELCPQLTFVSGHFKDYQRLGDATIKVIGDFTPLVERISIDEAFADVAGCTHLFGTPAEIATAIRQRVRTELGLPIPVGVPRTKHLAKIASILEEEAFFSRGGNCLQTSGRASHPDRSASANGFIRQLFTLPRFGRD